MAIGTDRVQVIKQESATLGGDSADERSYEAPIDPQEDALESAGLFVQDASNRDEDVYIARDGDDLIFRDRNNTTPRKLSELTGTASVELLLTANGQLMITNSGAPITRG